MKKILAISISLLSAFVVEAQNAGTHVWQFQPLLSGYNVVVPSNGIVGPQALSSPFTVADVTSTNVLFTKYNGQNVYSYSNNVNGRLRSSGFVGDAFNLVKLVSDANGDINANASLWIMLGQTNYIPTVGTNTSGQFIVPGYQTNGLAPALGGSLVPWPLAVANGPVWQGNATTNFFPLFGQGGQAITNQLIVNLYAVSTMNPKGGMGPDLNPTVPLAESTPSFTAYFPMAGNTAVTPLVFSTNLPTAFLQHARMVYMTIGFTNSIYTAGTNAWNVLLNQAGIVQPQ
ncbi:MAG: hypothetical protein KGL39_08595 [Patescibacteria group bacterium]|nr:hypothetical protein [Patescibacteria group bacterium]